MPDYSDDDYRLGYFTAPNGKITLLKPLNPVDLSNLFDRHSDQMADLQVQQVELEISRPPQPTQRSRQSQTSNGYIHLVAWSNCCLLRILMTAWFRWYRKIHGYDKGFYRNLQDFKGPILPLNSPKSPLNSPKSPPAPSPLTSLKLPLNSPNLDYPPVDNLDQSGNPRPLTSPKLPLNSFTPAWLNPKLLDRLEAQLLDSLRSTIANIEEGHGRPTTIEYLNFLGYTQASLKESKGDAQRLAQDELLPRRPESKLADLGINLSAWHAALKKSVIFVPPLTSPKSPLNSPKGTYGNLRDFKGAGKSDPLTSSKSPLNSFKFDYPPNPSLNTPKIPLNSSNSFSFDYAPVDNFDPSKLTYEMLIELINKTDWNLRQLVASLETKLNSDQKAYQLDRARIRAKVNWSK